MKIANVSVAPFIPALAPKISQFVTDPAHHVAFDPELAAKLGLPLQAGLRLSPSLALHVGPPAATGRPSGSAAANALGVAESIGKVGVLGLELVQSQYPAVGAHGALEGTEVVVLGLAAAKAWSETSEKGYTKAVLSTSSTVAEVLKLLEPTFPALNHLGPHIATVSIVLKIADALWQVRLDVQKAGGKQSP